MTLGLHRSLRLSGMFSSMAPCSGAATSRWTACRLDVDNRSLFTSPRRPRPATLNGQMHASVGSRSSPPLLSFAAACGAAPLGVPQSHWQCRWSSTSGICTHASTARAYSTRQWVQRSAGSQMHNQKQVSFGSAVKRTHNRKAFQATSSRGAADEGDTAALDGTTEGESGAPAEPFRPIPGKRKVALHLAYEGSAYRGLQLQRGKEGVRGGTIEDVLEAALHAAGAISDANVGDLHKIGWSRGSRTDKGVHSLSTVVAFKIECDPNSFDLDPEGLALAAGINAHLPSDVRVLACQRVNNGFNARDRCADRTYQYYLPTSAIGISAAGDSAEDADRLQRLHDCFAHFNGSRAFHNYTKRRLYRAGVRDTRPHQGSRKRRGSSSDDDSDSDEELVNSAITAAGGAMGSDQSGSMSMSLGSSVAEGDSSSGASSSAAESSSYGGTSEGGAGIDWRFHPQYITLGWNSKMQPSDRIERAHFRHLRSIIVDEAPRQLVPGGTPCIRIELCGNSFMLHQIRHMVGAAVAVARGTMSIDYIAASMAVPARCSLPLAPPYPLLLSGCSFLPFPIDMATGVATVQPMSGEALHLRGGALASQEVFQREVLYPALEALLQHPDWDEWSYDLNRTEFRPAEYEEFMSNHREWKLRSEELRLARIAEYEANAGSADLLIEDEI